MSQYKLDFMKTFIVNFIVLMSMSSNDGYDMNYAWKCYMVKNNNYVKSITSGRTSGNENINKGNYWKIKMETSKFQLHNKACTFYWRRSG